MRILAVDDDPQALRYVRDALSKAGYTCRWWPGTRRRRSASWKSERAPPGVVGPDAARDRRDRADGERILETWRTCRSSSCRLYGQDQIVVARALRGMGAVDYVVKPFSPTELAARIQGGAAQADRYRLGRTVGALRAGRADGQLRRTPGLSCGRPVQLTDIEYRLLCELTANAGRVLTHDQLLQRVWGLTNSGDSGPVRTVVKTLRRKLGDEADSPTYIFNEPRIGYRIARGEKTGRRRRERSASIRGSGNRHALLLLQTHGLIPASLPLRHPQVVASISIGGGKPLRDGA